MKKFCIAMIMMISMVMIAACGKNNSKEVSADPAALAKQLAEETVSSDTLSEINTDIMASTYFVDTEKIDSSSAYLSTGASACEATVIKCKDSSYVSEVETLFKNRVTSQTDLFSSYNAGETKKLQNAIIKTSGNYVVLCICDDTSKAEEILKEAGF